VIKVFVPLDSAALSMGADEVAIAIVQSAASQGVDITLIRTGSRGMLWLEPLVEVETSSGRVGFANISAESVPELIKSGALETGSHKSSIGLVEEHDFFKNQNRVTFARVGVIDPLSISDYENHGGLVGLRKALEMSAAEVVSQVTESGLRGRGGAGFPAGIKWQTVLNTIQIKNTFVAMQMKVTVGHSQTEC